MDLSNIAEAHSPSIRKGITLGVGAGALWGLVFLAPALIPQFNGIYLAVGRYLAYGFISALFLLPQWKKATTSLRRTDFGALFGLALLGNTLYYVLLATAVQTAGIALTSLVIGFLPVAVTIIGSRDQGAVPLTKLWPSLLLCAAGAVCISWQALSGFNITKAQAQLIGILCAGGALGSWTSYAVWNSRSLKRLPTISANDWNLLTGAATGVQAVLLVPVALILDKVTHTGADWWKLTAVSTGVAVLASIAGNTLWNRMSRLLPLTLTGQMILFETLFALIYGFIWEKRLPTLAETAAFGFVILSVTTCMGAHRTPRVQTANTPL